jgi:hypothetical protein
MKIITGRIATAMTASILDSNPTKKQGMRMNKKREQFFGQVWTQRPTYVKTGGDVEHVKICLFQMFRRDFFSLVTGRLV